jgi:hypothetical protein
MVAPIHHQVVVYAADPQRLARFWAAAMGYELENNEVLIEPLLAAGVAQESDTVVVNGQRFWDGVLAIRHPDDPVDEKTGIVQGRRIMFELQETQKTDENQESDDLDLIFKRGARPVRVAVSQTLLFSLLCLLPHACIDGYVLE